MIHIPSIPHTLFCSQGDARNAVKTIFLIQFPNSLPTGLVSKSTCALLQEQETIEGRSPNPDRTPLRAMSQSTVFHRGAFYAQSAVPGLPCCRSPPVYQAFNHPGGSGHVPNRTNISRRRGACCSVVLPACPVFPGSSSAPVHPHFGLYRILRRCDAIWRVL